MRLKKDNTNRALFLKCITSYLVILLIPTLIFTVFISGTLINNLKEKYIAETSQTLQQYRIVVEKNVLQTQEIRDQLLTGNRLVPALNLTDVIAAKAMIGELKNFVTANGFFLDIALYFRGDSYIYSSQSSHQAERFFAEKLGNSIWDYESFIREEAVRRGREIKKSQDVLLDGKATDMITIIYPVTYRSTHASVIFFVDSRFLRQSETGDALFVLDETGTTIFEDNPNGLAADGQEFSKEYLVNKLVSEDTGWTYIKISRTSKVFQDLLRIQRTFYLIILMVLFGGGLVIFTGIHYSYKPLSRLLVHLNREITVLRDYSAKEASRQTLMLIMKGRIEDRKEFERLTEENHLHQLKFPHVYMMIIAVKGMEKDGGSVVGKLEEIVTEYLEGYVREGNEVGRFFILGSMETSSGTRLLHSALDVQESLNRALNAEVVVGVSKLHQGFSEYPQCYMEASLAVDYRFVKGNNCVIDNAQLVLNEDMKAVYPKHIFEKLNYQIKQGNAEKIGEVMNEIISYIKNTDLPLYYVKGICFQLIHMISSVLDDLSRELKISKSKISYGTVLADFDTAEDLLLAVHNISLNICAYVQSENEKEHDLLLQKMKVYIDEHVFETQFSAQAMADYMNMALPAASTFFKQNYDTTIINYVTALRMEKAKELLLEGTRTVNEIVILVGYISPSSFIRKFKSIYGLTPGEFIKNQTG